MSLGVVPCPWQQSIIKPIPKPGGNSIDPNDYRGISLQSVVTKVLCYIMNSRLCEYLEHLNLLVEEQNGFRKGRSCQDHIFSLHSIIHCRKILRQDTYAVFIDFRKAFDSVNRELLWNKLQQKFGIQGSFLTLLKGLYNHVRSCVRVNGELTEWFDINSGVKQGCILSPILFSMFINDLVTEINIVWAKVLTLLVIRPHPFFTLMIWLFLLAMKGTFNACSTKLMLGVQNGE